ncbi:MAG: RsiV family protein [Lachnospiraceae bacterium]|nr:RsiV family protein [Lachnospiraceae bacterium]
MNQFDDFLKAKAREEAEDIPDCVIERIEQTLSQLPERKNKTEVSGSFSKYAVMAAGFLLVFLIIPPNVSTAYAQALEKVPVISNIVKVVTIRNYFYSDDNHEMNVNMPKIEDESSGAAEDINKEIDEMTEILVGQFYEEVEEIGDQGYGAVYTDYSVLTNTEKWFTLRIQVHEDAGSSNTYYKYYHIDRNSGKLIQLGDLAADDRFYSIIENEIKRQMREQMAEDINKKYWVDDAELGQDFVKLAENHNFYWDENEDLVIVFDKYEVAPGYMGTPEFTVSKELIRDVLNTEYR